MGMGVATFGALSEGCENILVDTVPAKRKVRLAQPFSLAF